MQLLYGMSSSTQTSSPMNSCSRSASDGIVHLFQIRVFQLPPELLESQTPNTVDGLNPDQVHLMPLLSSTDLQARAPKLTLISHFRSD